MPRYEFPAWFTVDAENADKARDMVDELVHVVVRGDVGVGIAYENNPQVIEPEDE